ncbi:MAG: DUF1653 domain-containing protein [Lachnospiraceae bacterium]|nr:DUF1653 domain-containing protein [Lachnospiraceae bacterium]
MNQIPRPGEIYQHFKGNLYRIVAIAEHTESAQQLVVYQALYGNYQVYARPLEMFMQKVDRSKYPLDQYPQFQAEYRFTRLPLAEPAKTGEYQETELQEMTAVSVEGMQKESLQEKTQQEALTEEEPGIDPLLLAFLDADGYERKLEIFDSLHMRIDQSMLNTVAVSLDLEIPDGDLEEQYQTLRSCMLTLEKYECNRLR